MISNTHFFSVAYLYVNYLPYWIASSVYYVVESGLPMLYCVLGFFVPIWALVPFCILVSIYVVNVDELVQFYPLDMYLYFSGDHWPIILWLLVFCRMHSFVGWTNILLLEGGQWKKLVNILSSPLSFFFCAFVHASHLFFQHQRSFISFRSFIECIWKFKLSVFLCFHILLCCFFMLQHLHLSWLMSILLFSSRVDVHGLCNWKVHVGVNTPSSLNSMRFMPINLLNVSGDDNGWLILTQN